jgi:hypothetical protein
MLYLVNWKLLSGNRFSNWRLLLGDCLQKWYPETIAGRPIQQ